MTLGAEEAEYGVCVVTGDVTCELEGAAVDCAEVVAVGWLPPLVTTVPLPAAVVDAATPVGVPRDGVAEQLVADNPTVKERRPSAARASEACSGKVPTYVLKL